MRKRKRIPYKMLPLFLAALVLFGCADSSTGEQSEASIGDTTADNSASSIPALSESALTDYSDWNLAEATTITLNGSEAVIDGTGASVEQNTVTITDAGIYVLRGSYEGQIAVEAAKGDTVQLVLDGVTIACDDSAAIYASSTGTTVIYLAEGSDNHLADGSLYQYADASADEPDAALFAKNDLVIAGGGSLSVAGNYNNGIGSKDNLVIQGGSITVDAVNHGIRGRDSVTITDGSFTITSGNDGIQSNNDSGEDKGWILLEGGTYGINAAHDGIQAETSLTINGGSFDIQSGGGSTAVPADSDGSYKGLKAGGDLSISAGTFTLNCADDTLHANGDITIWDGTFLLYTGDDGAHADGCLAIHGGDINIVESYEGLEGSKIEITGGTIHLNASDDGINVAGGKDSGEGRFGRDRFQVSDDMYLSISGGWISVTASGDGVDSNSNIYMSGGTLLVNGPTSNGDAAIDYDGSFEFTGGVLVAAGSAGMAQAPGTTQQPVLIISYTTVQPGGTAVHVAAEDGTPILTYTPTKNYQNIVISAPDLVSGAIYKVYTGGSAADAEDGLSLAGDYTAGTHLFDVTLAEDITRVNDSGEAVSGGMFGGMGGGPGGGGMGGGRTPPDGDFPGTPPEGGGGGRGQRGGGPGEAPPQTVQ